MRWQSDADMVSHGRKETDLLRTMTPLPKYFAVSNAFFGTRVLSHFVRLDNTGNSAPNAEPTRITKMDAILRDVLLSSPPPEPQSTSLASSLRRNVAKIMVICGESSGRRLSSTRWAVGERANRPFFVDVSSTVTVLQRAPQPISA